MARILVIDDSQVIRDLLSDFLSDAGHFVDTAADGQEGIDMATQGDYDICICDLHIPRKSGYDVYCEVSGLKPQLRFIMTDSLPDHLAEKTSAAGVPYCLRKPFDLNQLRSVLDKVCASLKPVR